MRPTLPPGEVLGRSAVTSAKSPAQASTTAVELLELRFLPRILGHAPQLGPCGEERRDRSLGRRGAERLAGSLQLGDERAPSRGRATSPWSRRPAGSAFIGSPASSWKASGVGPRRRAAPKPWLLWLLRLSAASSG